MLTYATFVTGLQEPISNWLVEEGYRIRQMLDGAILYEAQKNKKILPCFFNTFSVLDLEKKSGPKAVEQLMRKVLQRQLSNASNIKRGRGSFRIVTSRENQLIAVDKKLRSDVERLIAFKTGLVPDRRGGGREFWFLARSEGIVLFMERQPSHKEHPLKKGELRPQLAYCLNRLAAPTPEDIMLDPFCGYGAITRTRANYFPCKAIYGIDIDRQKIKALQQRASTTKGSINYSHGDIRRLSSTFPTKNPASIDVIVTDPPWGLYGDNKEDDISSLYKSMAAEFSQIIKPGGRIVILTAQKELLRTHINKGLWGNTGNLKAFYDILVSGQKAAIFVIKASAN